MCSCVVLNMWFCFKICRINFSTFVKCQFSEIFQVYRAFIRKTISVSFAVCAVCDVVYTLFALSEYFIVLSNIAYHGTAIIEFGVGKLLYVNQPLESKKTS